MEDWVQQEVEKCEFPGHRLKARLGKIFQRSGHRIGDKISTAW